MPHLEASNPIKIGHKKFNLAEAQDKNFKITVMNMFTDLKMYLDKCFNEDL